jgi:AcrR family transcriptional regulator
LLQAALLLFAERGYEATTIEEIAHTAGVAVGGFYQHFASKKQLLLVLMDRLLSEVASLSSQVALTDVSQTYLVIEQVVRQGLLVDWAYVGAYRAWREAIALDAELRTLHEQLERWTTLQIEGILRPLLQLPGVRQGVDIVTLAWIVTLLFWRLAEVPLQEPDAVVTTITTIIYHTIFMDEHV